MPLLDNISKPSAMQEFDALQTASNATLRVLLELCRLPQVPTGDPELGNTTAEERIACHVAGGIDICTAADLTYDDFLKTYMEPNRPVLIQGVTHSWRAAREWVRPDGGVDMDAMERLFGTSYVWATDVSRRLGGCGERCEMTFAQYADWWRRHSKGVPSPRCVPEVPAHPSDCAAVEAALGCGAEGDAAGPGEGVTEGATGGEDAALLYLKDWHLASLHVASLVL